MSTEGHLQEVDSAAMSGHEPFRHETTDAGRAVGRRLGVRASNRAFVDHFTTNRRKTFPEPRSNCAFVVGDGIPELALRAPRDLACRREGQRPRFAGWGSLPFSESSRLGGGAQPGGHRVAFSRAAPSLGRSVTRVSGTREVPRA